MNRRTFSLRRRAVAVCIGSAVVVGLLPSCAPDAPKFNAVDITGAEYARDFPLTDHLGQRRSIKDFPGKIVAVFFGFAQCPDVCPTTMAEMAEVKKLLGTDGQKLQVIFITVDPQRDTAEVMKAYMANFDPTFLALLPTPDQLEVVAKDFKVFYKRSMAVQRTDTPWTILLARMSLTPKGASGCSVVTAVARKKSLTTSRHC